jgi:DNA modification methylase
MSGKYIGQLELNRIYQRDCIEGMRLIPGKSIDMILCDLPYGTTRNKWDTVIDLNDLWAQYKRIIKENGAIVLTAQTPFDKVLGAITVSAQARRQSPHYEIIATSSDSKRNPNTSASPTSASKR